MAHLSTNLALLGKSTLFFVFAVRLWLLNADSHFGGNDKCGEGTQERYIYCSQGALK